jgi:hypothetical protein
MVFTAGLRRHGRRQGRADGCHEPHGGKASGEPDWSAHDRLAPSCPVIRVTPAAPTTTVGQAGIKAGWRARADAVEKAAADCSPSPHAAREGGHRGPVAPQAVPWPASVPSVAAGNWPAASATNPAVRGGREVAGPLPATEPGSPRRPGGRRAASRNGTRQSQHPRRPRARRAASATDPAVLPSAPAGVRTQPRAPSHRHHPAFTAMASRAGGLASQGPAAHQTNGREDDRQRPACARALGSLRHRGGGGAPANTPGAPYLQPVAPAAAARAGRAPGRCRQARPGGFRVRPGGPPMGA